MHYYFYYFIVKRFPAILQKNLKTMWCLGISMAHPDHKRPFASSTVYFFETETEALNKLKACKISFIKDRIDDDERVDTLSVNSPDALIEEIFEEVNDPDSFYTDCYMDQPPFHWNVMEIQSGGEMKF